MLVNVDDLVQNIHHNLYVWMSAHVGVYACMCTRVHIPKVIKN